MQRATISRRMLRSRITLALTLAAGTLLAACGDANPPSPFPPSPTAASLAPQTMLLRPNQLAGYVRSEDVTVSAQSLADQENDQSLVATLQREGLQMGARATYSDPSQGGAPTPFATVISQVLIFADEAGATSFYGEESKRRSKPPDAGTLTPLQNLPLGGADAVAGLAASVPAQSSDQGPARALFAIIRRGRLVAELLGGGSSATATDDRFIALVTVQEQQLAAQPE